MTRLAARLGSLTNLTHGFIYFADEAVEEYDAVGLAPHQQYFASRAAPMGAVGPELVTATFFNFSPDRVAAAVPSCWEVASPADVQAARLRGAGRALVSACADIDAALVAEATALARAMVDGVGDEGKPLAAANRTVEVPDDPWIVLFQLITIIREWRGDAHVAVLTSHAVTAVEALVLHAATGTVPRVALETTRGWPEGAWSQAIASLQEKGLVEAGGEFTDIGRDFREAIEEETDRAVHPLIAAIGPDDTQHLCDLLKPIRDALIAAGAFERAVRQQTPEPTDI